MRDLSRMNITVIVSVSVFPVDIYTDDNELLDKLHRYFGTMLTLGMLRGGEIWQSKGEFDGIKHVVKSQATENCHFGEDEEEGKKGIDSDILKCFLSRTFHE